MGARKAVESYSLLLLLFLCIAKLTSSSNTPSPSPPLPCPQALHKNEGNKLKEAKRFSIISFALVVIFAISYPILVTVVVLASVFGYICDYQYRERGYYSYYSYSYRPSYCAR